ncbi:hypothetical protein CFC21_089105 [Triticum aestivum]|uniref:Uncharacterized protein n=2 Tax=Triticum aestivum TaxID=4565 RepID=A0A9R1IK90_WHEAT|nr:hypothetical protein CFC21_089105 [Triticum aestivum]
MTSVRAWWNGNLQIYLGPPKALASVMMLISWEIWTERNARVFRNTAILSTVLISKIKAKMSLWAMAGAKYMSVVMPRE